MAAVRIAHADRSRYDWLAYAGLLKGLVRFVVLAWALLLPRPGDWDGAFHRAAVSWTNLRQEQKKKKKGSGRAPKTNISPTFFFS